jgi:hypothetical protein
MIVCRSTLMIQAPDVLVFLADFCEFRGLAQ